MKELKLPKDKIGLRLNREDLTSLNSKIKEKTEKLYNQNTKPYILQDGAPYANGEAHLGHIMNKCLKDFIVKRKLQEGYKVDFKFGWDCHGLPIENKSKKDNVSCEEIVDNSIKLQKDVFNLYGIFNTNGIYRTLNEDYKQRQLDLYNQLLSQGDIYQDYKPVFYSPTLKTVLANSEVEYKDITEQGLIVNIGGFLVYTSTEWSLKGNQAVCLNENITYVLTDFGICSERFAKEEKLEYRVLKSAEIPCQYDSKKVLWNDFVQDTDTGIVHLAGGHGIIDFEVLKKNDIEPKNVCEIENFLEHVNNYKSEYKVYKYVDLVHSYPIDWREGNKVYYFATLQYFVRLDHDKVKEQVKNIKMSAKDKTKFLDTLFSRKEWCISRQRKWGVQIPESNDIMDVWFDSGSAFTMNDIADIYIEGIDQYRGWFQSSVILSSLVNKQCTKQIVSHGFIVDEFKEKLSKSKSNFQSVTELYEKYNPDVIRLFIALSDWKSSLMFSEENLKNTSSIYFRLRNYLRYFVNNIYELENDYQVSDKFIKSLSEYESKINQFYDNLDFKSVVNYSLTFIGKYSSSLTEDVKNQFYECGDNRLQLEKEFQLMLKSVSNCLYPIVPFLIEELNN